MTNVMSAFNRSTGIVAAILAVAALLWGFLFSARATGERRRPNWWLDLHNWLGGLALIFTGVHIAAAWLQSDSGIGIGQILIPGTAGADAWPITWGVPATYLLAAAVFTTWPRKLGNRRLWRMIHVGSVAGTGLALLHSYQSGSEASRVIFQAGLTVLVGVTVYGLAIRLVDLPARRR
jgi:hypothetical protein